LKAAGIDVRSRSKYATLRSTPTETMIEDVVYVSSRIGRLPTMREYEMNGHYSCTAVRGRLGSWRMIKEAVAEKTAGFI
jgi:hypothetical protein